MAGRRRQRKTRKVTIGKIAGTVALLAVAGLAVFLAVKIIGGRGEGEEGSAPRIVETRSGAAPEPFRGGPRLHLPIAEVDFGQVPLMTPVSYSFDLMNVGDTPLTIADVNVRMLEGC